MSGNESFCEIRGQGFVMMHDWLIEGDLSDKALRVYMVLARHGQNPTNCFPSISRVAAKLKCSGRTVQRCIDELVQYGAVKRESRFDAAGSQRSNGYLIWAGFVPPTPCGSHFEIPDPMTSVSPRPRRECHTPPDMDVTHKENQLTKTSEQENTRVVSLENSQPALIEVDGLTPAVSVPDRFQEFYDAYGRKVGRAEAINEWKRAIKKVPAETIIQAAIAWRAAFDASGSDPCYVPHPSRWLKREQWADELPKPKTGARKTTRAPIVERTGETMNMKMVGGKLVPV